MKKHFVVFLSLIFSVSSVAFAQTRTVTNRDLEKFRQKRLQAEQQYRENYEKMGFPSPDELERKRLEDQRDLIEFSQRLEVSRLQREAAQAAAENQAILARNQYLQSQLYNSGYPASGYYYGYSPYYGYGGFYNYYPNNGYYPNRGRGAYNQFFYDSSTFRQYNPGFFNLQFPPPRAPQRIYAPATRRIGSPVRSGSANTRITFGGGGIIRH